MTVLAASGDAGATDYTANGSDFYTRRVTSWPDSDPLVTGVGGTQLIESGGGYTSVAWNDTYNQASDEYWGGSTDPDPLASGGGTSEYFARPSYQDGVKAVTGASRGVPDIAMSARLQRRGERLQQLRQRPAGLVADLRDQRGDAGVRGHRGARRPGCGPPARPDQPHPLRAARAARARPGRRHLGQQHASPSSRARRPGRYTVTGYQAVKGYNLVTGVGTVNASEFVYELAGVPVP